MNVHVYSFVCCQLLTYCCDEIIEMSLTEAHENCKWNNIRNKTNYKYHRVNIGLRH